MVLAGVKDFLIARETKKGNIRSNRMCRFYFAHLYIRTYRAWLGTLTFVPVSLVPSFFDLCVSYTELSKDSCRLLSNCFEQCDFTQMSRSTEL